MMASEIQTSAPVRDSEAGQARKAYEDSLNLRRNLGWRREATGRTMVPRYAGGQSRT